jgi:hypothetical protein
MRDPGHSDAVHNVELEGTDNKNIPKENKAYHSFTRFAYGNKWGEPMIYPYSV